MAVLGRGGWFLMSEVSLHPSLTHAICGNLRARACKHEALRQPQGTLAHKKMPPPQENCRALGIALLQGPRGRRFLIVE